jgi:hypothetical protein
MSFRNWRVRLRSDYLLTKQARIVALTPHLVMDEATQILEVDGDAQ